MDMGNVERGGGARGGTRLELEVVVLVRAHEGPGDGAFPPRPHRPAAAGADLGEEGLAALGGVGLQGPDERAQEPGVHVQARVEEAQHRVRRHLERKGGVRGPKGERRR